MCINIDGIHKTIIFKFKNSALTRDDNYFKDAMLVPIEISNSNNCID